MFGNGAISASVLVLSLGERSTCSRMCAALTRHGLDVLCGDNSAALDKYANVVRPDAIVIRTDEDSAQRLDDYLPAITAIRDQGERPVPTLLWTTSPLESSVRTLTARLEITVLNNGGGYDSLVRGIVAAIPPTDDNGI